MVTELLSATSEQVVIAFAVWALGMMRGNQTAEAAEAPYECQPAALPWNGRAALTTDRLNITQNPKNTNDQPSEQTSYSPTSNHYCYLVSQMTSPTCCSVKPACTGHRWPLRRRGWHHVWCVDLSSVSSTIVPGRLQWSSWRTLITQKHFIWGWSGSPPLFLMGRALSWATFARSQHMNQYMHTGPRMPSEVTSADSPICTSAPQMVVALCLRRVGRTKATQP